MMYRDEGDALRGIDELAKLAPIPAERIHAFHAGIFSQWARTPFVVDGNECPTAEHFMMASKARCFGDYAAAKKIMNCSTPREAKSLGRAVKNFNEKKWRRLRYGVVWNGNFLKFSQHHDARVELLETGEQILVEASASDAIWGVGLPEGHPNILIPSQWAGLNLLGFVLMSVRSAVRLLP